jgi:hypothetical protein
MEDKFTYYDVVAHLVPGTLVLGVLALMPRVFGFAMPSPKSGLVTVAAGVPLAYVSALSVHFNAPADTPGRPQRVVF